MGGAFVFEGQRHLNGSCTLGRDITHHDANAGGSGRNFASRNAISRNAIDELSITIPQKHHSQMICIRRRHRHWYRYLCVASRAF